MKKTFYTLKDAITDVKNTQADNNIYWLAQLLGNNPTQVFVADIISSNLDKKKREIVQQLFNLGVLDICLLSKAGAEGTDFKSTRASEMYVCSTDNRAVAADITQFKGRLNRFKSHELCPPEFREVHYNRICLFSDIKLPNGTDDMSIVKQTKRMSRFFYYKVPRKEYEIYFHGKHKDESSKELNMSSAKEKCLFCYINNPLKDLKKRYFFKDDNDECGVCRNTKSTEKDILLHWRSEYKLTNRRQRGQR